MTSVRPDELGGQAWGACCEPATYLRPLGYRTSSMGVSRIIGARVKRLRRAMICAPLLGLALGLAACSGGSTIPTSDSGDAAGGASSSAGAPASGGSLTVLVVAGGLASW